MTYDNIPEPYHQQLLSEFKTQYDDAITDTSLTDSTYRSLPTPVRQANLLHRIKDRVEHTSLQRHYTGPKAATKAIGATIMTESFFDQDATHPSDTSIGDADIGYAQVSPWTRSYLHDNEDFPATDDSTWFDVNTQVNFLTNWYPELHDGAHPNAVSVAAYNTGISDAINREDHATSYYDMWYERYTRYFDNPQSQTQDWILDQAGL